MDLVNIVQTYIKNPFPLWESDATDALVQNKWGNLKAHGLVSEADYCTAKFINDFTLPLGKRHPVSNNIEYETIYLESPSFDTLQHFYDEHGLSPCSELELKSNEALSKLNNAISLIDLVQPVYLCIAKLIRSIQVMKQENTETDVSYSHPKVPFSIFVSVCEDSSTISNLRVAESILHEAMHLKLTLIENIVQLVKPNTGNLYFSSWRDEKRPAQGVLHGLYVFRAILDFFGEIEKILTSDGVRNYLNNRKAQITYEIGQLKDFGSCSDLTEYGAILTKNLLP